MIERYEFGKMIYQQKTYKSDLIICPDKIIFPWWRDDGHNLMLDDLKEVLKQDFDMIIIGQGFSSGMRVSEQVLDYINKNSIYSFMGQTSQAGNVFNQYYKEKKVIGAFHLTC